MKYQVQTRQNGSWTDDGAPYDAKYKADKAVGEMVSEGGYSWKDVRTVGVAAIYAAPASDDWSPDLAEVIDALAGRDYPATL